MKRMSIEKQQGMVSCVSINPLWPGVSTTKSAIELKMNSEQSRHQDASHMIKYMIPICCSISRLSETAKRRPNGKVSVEWQRKL